MKNKGKCSVASCNKHIFCKGFCTTHYQQMRINGKIKEKDSNYIIGLCKIIGCCKKLFAKGFCQIHYLEQKEI